MDEPVLTPPLEYAPGAPLRRRRWRRRAIYALMIVAAGVAVWRTAPAFFRQARYVYWQSRCMSFTAPANFVAYEEEPTRAVALLNKAEYLKIPPATAVFC